MAAARPREEVARKARDTVDPRDTGVDSGDTGRDSRQRLIVKPSSRWTKERRFVLTSHFGKQEGQRFYRCTEISSGQQFLLKTVRVDESDEAARWRRDVTSWSQLGHPHILAYRDAWQSLDYQHVLCAPALMPLSELLHTMCPENPCQRLFSVWLFHILSALQYMHELHEENRPMLYRNVHPDCIVVTDKCCLQLCQFADTKQLDGPHGTTRTVVGQGLFQSPEILQGLPYDKSADIWSAGVVSIFIADYARASKAGSIQKLRQILAESGLRKDLQAVILRAVQQEPGQRLDASGLISRLSQAVGPGLLKAPVPSSLYPSPLRKPVDSHTAVSKETEEESVFVDDKETLSAQTEPAHMSKRVGRGLQRNPQESHQPVRVKSHQPRNRPETKHQTTVTEATEPEECSELSPVVEERSHEEEGFADDSRVAVDRKTSNKLFIAAVSVKKRPRSEDSSARIREGERTKTTSEGIGWSAGGKKAFHPDDLSRLHEIITFRTERERGGGPWVWGLPRSSKSRQDTELTSGLGDSLPNTGTLSSAIESLGIQQISSQSSASANPRAQDRVHSMSSSTHSSSISRTSSSSSSVSMELRIPPETVQGQLSSADRAEEQADRDDDSPPEAHSQHWLHKKRTGVKDNLLSTLITTSSTQTEREENVVPPPPLVVRRWQTQATFSSAGSTLHLPNSDVSLVIPHRAVDSDRLVTVHGAACANVEYVSKVMAWPSKEVMISPLAEFSANEEFVFKRPVEIRLPVALPRNADVRQVRVYQIVRDPSGMKIINQIPRKPSNFASHEDTHPGRSSESRSQSNAAAQVWSEDGSFQVSEDGQVRVLTTHFSGYVCTYCGQLNTGPVELQVLATGNHRLKDQGRHSANVHVHVWDERLLIRDFREQYCMSCRNFQELDKTSLTLTGGIKGSHLSLSLTIFGEQEVRNWHHCRTPDGSPGLPEERVYSVDEVLGCKHAACPAGGSRLRPLEAKWKLESVSPSPPNLWFQCVIDIRHLLPPDSQATPRVAAPAHGRSLSVEMEAARDASFPSTRESQSRKPSMQHRFFQDLAHLPQKLPPPHANLPDYKDGSGGRDDRHPHGERGRGEVWNTAKAQARELGKVSDDDSLPSFPSLYGRLCHQTGQVALVDHPDHIQPPDPSYPPELHALEAGQPDQLIRPLGPPHEHDERSMPRGSCREQGEPSLPSDGSLQRKMNRLRDSLLPYVSVSSSEAGQSPATPHGMSNTAQTRSATPQDKSSTHQRQSSIPLHVGSTPQARSTTPHSKSSAQQRCSPTTRDISSTLQIPSPSPHDVSSTHQRRPPTSHGKSSTQQGRSPLPHSVPSTPQRSSPTPHDAYSTPQGRASSIPHRHHVAQQFTTPHAKINAQQCSANPHSRPHVTQTNFGHDMNSGQDVSHSGEANRAPQVSHSGEPNRAPGNQQGDMSAVKDQVAQMMRGAQNNQQLRQLCRLLLEVIPSTSQVSSDSNGYQAPSQSLNSDSSDSFLAVAKPSMGDNRP